MNEAVLPAHIDRNYGRYAGFLSSQVDVALDAARAAFKARFIDRQTKDNADARQRMQDALAEYHRALEAYLEYVAHAFRDSELTSEMRAGLLKQRSLVLRNAITFESSFSRLSTAYVSSLITISARHFKERFQKMSKAEQEILHAVLIGLPIAIGMTVRGLISGALGIAMYTASYISNHVMRRSLNKAEKKGPEWKSAKWILNTKGVAAAEAELQAAYDAYTEENRNESVKRIAHALAGQRRAHAVKMMRTMGARILTGYGAGMSTFIADAVVPGVDTFIHDPVGAIATPSEAATIHHPYGSTAELVPTADSDAFYDRIAALGGWFVVKNPNGSFELYYYDQSKGIVRHALGGARNLSEITEKPILEVSQKDLALLRPADRATVTAPQHPWYERPVKDIFGTNDMTEDEMRAAGIYTLNALPDAYPELTSDNWGRIAVALGRYTNAHPTVTELSGPGIIDRFITVFYPGSKGLPNKDVISLFNILFDDVRHNAQLNPDGKHALPDGQSVSTLMEMDVKDERSWFDWLIGRDADVHVQAAIDVISEGKPEWWQAVFLGHELGHLIQHITHADHAFNLLPAAEREAILREMHNFHDFQAKLRAEGARTHYKGWTEETYKLAMGGANGEDNEIFADLFSKLLTNPAEVKAHAPHFYEFMKNLINSDEKLRRVVAIP